MGTFKPAFLSLAVLTFLTTFPLDAATTTRADEAPIHEAYVTRIAGSTALEAIDAAPPAAINERIPKQIDSETLWIPGYWAWLDDKADFVWISGVWRRSPPGRQWIVGSWQQFDEGWVWLPGFWSEQPLESLTYLPLAPPDTIDEQVANPPSQDYFWMPGYWSYNGDYQWVEGQWQQLDPNWVLVPSHYIWRPDGYVFISAYWDWPIDERGNAYASVFIEPAVRPVIVYEPTYLLEPVYIVQQCLPYYPDYLCFFHHHYHYHVDYWNSCGCAMPWWGWETWWTFPWHDHWGLAWWYCHPGYPQPAWMTAHYAALIPPPSPKVLSLFKKAQPPAIVTPKGVVSSGKLLNILSKSQNGKAVPILPAGKRDKIKLQAALDSKIVPQGQPLRPSGKGLQLDQKPILKPPIAAEQLKDRPKPIKPLVTQPPKKPTIRLPGKPLDTLKTPDTTRRPPLFKKPTLPIKNPDTRKPGERPIDKGHQERPIIQKPLIPDRVIQGDKPINRRPMSPDVLRPSVDKVMPDRPLFPQPPRPVHLPSETQEVNTPTPPSVLRDSFRETPIPQALPERKERDSTSEIKKSLNIRRQEDRQQEHKIR